MAPLLRDPGHAALLTDIDGTLAPIVARAEDAAVSGPAVDALRALSERFALVGCISGRRAADARRMVGIPGLAYAGNHGLELLLPGEDRPRPHPSLAGAEDAAAAYLATVDAGSLARCGIRIEDKGPIQALHWRGAGDEEVAEARARAVIAAAPQGLEPRFGRKVAELKPAGFGGKDGSVDALLAGVPGGATIAHAVYAGDDVTDLDAFRRIRELTVSGELETGICIGVRSPEGPDRIVSEADAAVNGPEGWVAVLAELTA